MDFYTNVQVRGGKILYRGIKNGRRVKSTESFSPSLWTETKAQTNWKSMDGANLQEHQFKNIWEAKEFIKNIGATSPVFGFRRFEYSYIDENPPVDWNAKHIVTARIDIEVKSDNGFPEPELANEEITLISYKQGNKIYSFGLGEWNNDSKRKDVEYNHCPDEKLLLLTFLNFWERKHPDIITGWNVIGFDVIYIVNRIRKVLGEEAVNRLSPWKVVFPKMYDTKHGKVNSYAILGISIMDSIELYRKYTPEGERRDSYRLNNIGMIEGLGGKLDVGNLNKLYETDFNRYVDYNLRDIDLDEAICNKYDILTLVITIAYSNKVNFDDVFQQVRMWTAIADREYKKDGIILNHNINNDKIPYSGGFVKEPQVGNFRWVMSFDLTSLYPHLIMQYNISPETLLKYHTEEAVREFFKQGIDVERLRHRLVDTSILSKIGYGVTPNEQLFLNKKQGVLPRIMQEMYEARAENKRKQIEAEKLLQNETDKERIRFLSDEIAKYKSLQMALKVGLNSAYGATGSEFFVLFDSRLAEAITSSGRLAILWIGDWMNNFLRKTLKTDKNYIIAQDTDSMYVNLEDLVKATFAGKNPTEKEIVDFLDNIGKGALKKVIDEGFNDLKNYTNAFDQKMVMKRESIANIGFWTGKKRYALSVWDQEGVRYKHPKIKITGLESVKSSTPPKTRKAIEILIKLALLRGKKRSQNFIEKYRNMFHSFELRDIAIPTGVNGLDKYKMEYDGSYTSGTPMHVRSAIVYNKFIEDNGLTKKYERIKEGNKIRYVFLKVPNPTGDDVFAWEEIIPDELDIMKYLDYNALYNRTFLNPVSKIMSAMGWPTEDVLTLEDFMS
jgi:DNA polymerase elongation subunit (family B)